MSILEAVVVELPCPSCGRSYRVSLDVVAASQTTMHEGCPVPDEAARECPQETFARIVDEEALAELERAWTRVEHQIANAGGKVHFAGRPSSAPPRSLAGERATEPVRREHAHLREHLAEIDGQVAALAAEPADDQGAKMASVAGFFRKHIAPHAAWEERALYPVVDEHGPSAGGSVTATMRHEHRIIGREIDELARIAQSPQRDVAAFARAANRLLGLLTAHFDEEEEVLLAILDRDMTPEQFQREVLSAGGEEHSTMHA